MVWWALIVAALVFAAAYGFKHWDQNTSRSAETGSNNHPSSSSSAMQMNLLLVQFVAITFQHPASTLGNAVNDKWLIP